ncbi:hypothetical protein RHMOL_Rhmol11G0216100 [Rhododendron molle]|uniref:Uncharacterized protein n=1 Tax=Rhododendron molle TaxID=49168 RepID=A0ACC0LV37_RHOML|nr:hypothetical protein RHMOL_Rhmol11G0216100 [Rhododendron molle]
MGRGHPYRNEEERLPRGVSERRRSLAVEEIGESKGRWGRWGRWKGGRGKGGVDDRQELAAAHLPLSFSHTLSLSLSLDLPPIIKC